jgi:pimeloyl-ACP methyl ester carboxylesterase
MKKIKGHIEYYESSVDGVLLPYAVCLAGEGDRPLPVMMDVSPGAQDTPESLAASLRGVESIARLAEEEGIGCIALRMTGRGPGSVYQNYGEVDVFETLDDVASKYSLDRDRISVLGGSMGGAATWYLISHYPDVFSAASPRCGYCDYRLWERPGGMTFHLNEWEEPSWQARSAAFLCDNLEHTPQWILHGEWDRAVGGGVPVAHSRNMAAAMKERNFPCQYTELPAVGHSMNMSEELNREVLVWMLSQVKERSPKHVSLVTYGLRHNRSYWVTIEQLSRYGEEGKVDARLEDGAGLVVTTGNVRTLSLGPVPGVGRSALEIDGFSVGEVDLSGKVTLRCSEDGSWRAGGSDSSGEKRHSCSGPISDLFFDGTIFVMGASGTEEETFFNEWAARNTTGYFKKRNGGVHRGGIMGENSVSLPRVLDIDLDEETLKSKNLVLWGRHRCNAVLSRFEGEVPFSFGEDWLELRGRRYRGEKVTVFASFPHPLNPDRYLAVHAGVTPDGVTWGCHLDYQLLPDYIVYDGGRLLDSRFWDSEWRYQD